MEVLAAHVKYNNYILVKPKIGTEFGGEQCDEWDSCKTPLVTKMNYRVVTRAREASHSPWASQTDRHRIHIMGICYCKHIMPFGKGHIPKYSH
jgi:hypothetical protein